MTQSTIGEGAAQKRQERIQIRKIDEFSLSKKMMSCQ